MVDLLAIDRTNSAAQFLYEGAQELLGADLLRTMTQEHPSADGCGWTLADVGPFLRGLETRFGAAGSQGMTLRIGRAAFRYGLKQLGDQVGFRTVEFRLLPAPRRLQSGLKTMAGLMSEACHCDVVVTDEGPAWQWNMRWQGAESGLPCYLVTGLLQEFSSWAGNGRFYQVTETDCQAGGAPTCTFRIDKRPLD